MGLLIDNGIVELLGVLYLTVWCFYWYLTKNYDYWDKRGVPNKKPKFPFGSTKEIILTETFIGKGHYDIYKTFPNERYYGIIDFRKPSLVLKDPELIKKIMVKDFQHFVDRPVFMGNPKESILLNLSNLTGQDWKFMRTKLTPTFTSGKMKIMFSLMEHCSEILKDKLDEEVKEGGVIDVKDMFDRFIIDIIASCAFGLETNNVKDAETEFYCIFKKASKTSKFQYLRKLVILVFPDLLKMFRVNLIQPETRDFVTNLVHNTIEYRQKNNVKRNDFLDLLINIKHKKDLENNDEPTSGAPTEGLTVEQIAAQTMDFFLSGFSTTSSTMAFCLYELACNQHIQEQLYHEIHGAVGDNGGKISYQLLTELQFLDQVINETLRLYGIAHNLSRICTKSYKIPDSDLIIEKGVRVVVPLYSLHHDPKYYPEPFEFNPDRFTPEETKKRHPFVFLPFGEGPRNCIGMRFGLIQAKIGLSTILLNFQVQLSPEQEVPMEIDKRSVPIMPAKPVLLQFSKRIN